MGFLGWRESLQILMDGFRIFGSLNRLLLRSNDNEPPEFLPEYSFASSITTQTIYYSYHSTWEK